MDTDQEDTRLAELREALRCAPLPPAEPRTFEIRATASQEQLSLDLTDLTIDALSSWTADQIPCLTTDQISALDLSSISINNHNTTPAWSFSDLSVDTRSSGKISLTGADADIEINGESVVSLLREIKERLNILKVSTEMETEWDELRVLREQYEAKLTECQEKSMTWRALQQTQ